MTQRSLPALGLALLLGTAAAPAATPVTPSADAVLARSTATEWREPDPANLLYMELPAGRVVIELAPGYTPRHAANIRALARAHYFDGLAIIRVQDDFVTQWGAPEDPTDGYVPETRALSDATATLPPEFTHPIDPKARWTPLPDGDLYAPQVGFTDQGFPAGRDPRTGGEWLLHCYGMVGVARDNGPETGNGSSLYVAIGAPARRLDRNLAVAGRVLVGMPLLSGLPRGTGPIGFYADPAQQVPIKSVQVAADLPASARMAIEVLRTDSPTYAALLNGVRHRHDAFYKVSAGKVGVCDVPAPVRAAPPTRTGG